MIEQDETVTLHDFMKTDYQDNKLDKSNELNETMSIDTQSPDQYENTLHNIGGNS